MRDKYNVNQLPEELKYEAMLEIREAALLNPTRFGKLPAALEGFEALEAQQNEAEQAGPDGAPLVAIPGMGGAQAAAARIKDEEKQKEEREVQLREERKKKELSDRARQTAAPPPPPPGMTGPTGSSMAPGSGMMPSGSPQHMNQMVGLGAMDPARKRMIMGGGSPTG
jgi:hypothetical protein